MVLLDNFTCYMCCFFFSLAWNLVTRPSVRFTSLPYPVADLMRQVTAVSHSPASWEASVSPLESPICIPQAFLRTQSRSLTRSALPRRSQKKIRPWSTSETGKQG